MDNLLMNSVIAGIISLVIGLGATYLAELVFPTNNLQWALIAVGFASFFAGLASYMAGDARTDQEMTMQG